MAEGLAEITPRERSPGLQRGRDLQISAPLAPATQANLDQPPSKPGVAQRAIDANGLVEGLQGLGVPVLGRQQEAAQGQSLRMTRGQDEPLLQRRHRFGRSSKAEFQFRHPHPGRAKTARFSGRFAGRRESLGQFRTGLQSVGARHPFAGRRRGAQRFEPDVGHRRDDFAQRAGQGSRRRKRLQAGFRLLHLPRGQQQGRAPNPLGIRARLPILRVSGQGAQEIPEAIQPEGLAERLLFCGAQPNFIGVNHRRVIQHPLNDPGSVEERRFFRRTTGLNHGLLAAVERLGPLRSRQIDFPIEDRHHCASVFGHCQMKFRPSNRSRSNRSAELNFCWLLAAEEVAGAGFEFELGLSPGVFRRPNFQAGQLIDPGHAQVRPAEGGAAPESSAHPVAFLKTLVLLSGRPLDGSFAGHFDLALDGQQPAGGLGGSRVGRKTHPRQHGDEQGQAGANDRAAPRQK